MKHIEYSNKFQIMCVSPKRCVQKGYFGKLKSKDSYHTRGSKQNTYHVVNKNIAPSKVTDGSRGKRGCLPGHPQALAFGYSWISWGGKGIPKLRLLPLLIPLSIKSLPKTWKLHNTKLNRKSHELRYYKKINHHIKIL